MLVVVGQVVELGGSSDVGRGRSGCGTWWLAVMLVVVGQVVELGGSSDVGRGRSGCGTWW